MLGFKLNHVNKRGPRSSATMVLTIQDKCPNIPWGRISTSFDISVLKNDRKCRFDFMFHEKNTRTTRVERLMTNWCKEFGHQQAQDWPHLTMIFWVLHRRGAINIHNENITTSSPVRVTEVTTVIRGHLLTILRPAQYCARGLWNGQCPVSVMRNCLVNIRKFHCWKKKARKT